MSVNSGTGGLGSPVTGPFAAGLRELFAGPISGIFTVAYG
jgi:hypothetical protein